MQPYKRAREQGDASGSNRLYKLLVKPSWHGSVWKPKWNPEQRQETHFRPTGPMTEDRTNFLPWRLSGEESNFGPWLGALPIITFGTVNKTTCVAAFENPDKPGEPLDVDTNPTPITDFIANVRALAKNNPNIEVAFLKGGKGRGAALPRLTAMGLMQGLLLHSGTKSYYTEPRYPSVMMLSSSACTALEDTLNAEVEGYAGDPENHGARFKCGDILDPNAGRVISFYTDGAPVDAPAAATQQAVNWNRGASGAKKEANAREFRGYACEIVQRNGAPMPFALPRRADGTLGIEDRDFFTPWSEVIRYLTAEEMVMALVKSFEDYPDVLLAALKPYHDILPKYIKQNASVTVAAPAGAMAGMDQLPGIGPQAYGPQAPQYPQGYGPGQPVPQSQPVQQPQPTWPTQPQAQTATTGQPPAGVNWGGGYSDDADDDMGGEPEEYMGEGSISPEDMGAFSGGQPAATAQPASPAAMAGTPGAQNAAMQGALNRLNSLKTS